MLHGHYVAVDGDDVGNHLRTPIITNDLPRISAISRAITTYFDQLDKIFRGKGYDVIFCAGDSLLAYFVEAIDLPWLMQLPQGACTISIGIGATPEYAYLALQLAKARGKNRIVQISGVTAETIYTWGKQ